jgi:hypothetical protein
MALNGTGIEFGKSEHDSRRRIRRATTISADFIVLLQRCGVQVVLQKVRHKSRWCPLAMSPCLHTAVDAWRGAGVVGQACPAPSVRVSSLVPSGTRDSRHRRRFFEDVNVELKTRLSIGCCSC